MRYRTIFLLSSVALGTAGAFGLACSGGPKPGELGGKCFANMTCSGSLTCDPGTVLCVESSQEAGLDGGTDGKLPDTGIDGGSKKCPNPPGYPIKGACDPVAQDCAGRKECVVNVVNGAPVTECVDPKTGSVPKGGKCTSTSDCVPGAECIPQGAGRCAPHCCALGNDTPCGVSVPEGYIGTCSINVQYVMDMSKPTGLVCAYAANCKPFKIQPCPMGSACLVEDMAGAADCNDIFMKPGKTAGQACMYKNDCQDGLGCVNGGPDGGNAICMWYCYRPPGPYDAGIAQLAPGLGGCPANKTCSIGLAMRPAWLGLCTP